jgi:alpha-N-arabinofuranosidase
LIASLALSIRAGATAYSPIGSSIQGQRVKAVINAGRTNAPISKYVYGQFLEHIGDIVNKGVWAEMLDDRKFYNPVIDKEPPASNPGRPGRGPIKRWTMIGPVDAFVMDTDHPFTGKQSPLVKLADSEPRGIRQARLTVGKDTAYTGRIVLAGDPRAKVAVSLVWGSDANDHQTVTISGLGANYKTYALAFKTPIASAETKFEIIGTGSGSFHIGAVSLMPADNI